MVYEQIRKISHSIWNQNFKSNHWSRWVFAFSLSANNIRNSFSWSRLINNRCGGRMMINLEIFGIALTAIAIIYAFFKKKDKIGMALIIVLLVLLFILSQLGRL